MSASPCSHICRDAFSGFHQGQVLADKYVLLEPLGAGGMGQVWTARNLATGAEVAIKLLLAARAHSAVARFRREACATAQLAHRGIVRVFDLVELADADGSVAMVMERLHGKTLAEHLEHNGPLGVAQTLGIILPILGALHHAHRLGTIHRDLKPENIFLALEPDGALFPKLLDFGISKLLRTEGRPLTGDGLIVGTPSHMSPEQLSGAEVDARSDVFCVGILLYMCIVGRNPFSSDHDGYAVTAVLETPPPPPPGMAPELWGVIARALARRPDDRFGSAAELADALTAWANRSSDGSPDRSDGSRTSITVAEDLPFAFAFPFAFASRRRVATVAAAACFVGLSFLAASGSSRKVSAASAPRSEASRSAHALPQVRAEAPDVLLQQGGAPGASPSAAKPDGRARVTRTVRGVLRDPGF